MNNNQFVGTGVAVITPFRDGKVDYIALEKIIEHLIEGDVDYLVPLGSTGESALLSPEEEREVLDFVISVNKARKPIVAGNFGAKNTLELCKKIEGYNFDGIDAILSSSPEYIKPSQEGIYLHYQAIEKISPVPIIIYNVPSRTRSNIEWQTTVRLAKSSNKFIGIKEATGDLIQATRIAKNRPKGFLLMSGDDETALPMIAVGGQGVISVMANVFPKHFAGMIKAALNDEMDTARKINNNTYDLHHYLYVEGNPVGIKAAMEYKGFCTRDVRLPLTNMSEKGYESLKRCLDQIA